MTLAFVILLFAGFVRAGSSTNASLSGRKALGEVRTAGDTNQQPKPLRSESDEVTYWHDLAVKRLKLVGKREHRIVSLQRRLHALATTSHRDHPHKAGMGVRQIICHVFGSQCSKALSVAWCESRFNVYARNGQYLGLFQEGEFARAHYGFGWNAWAQARSAHRYYLDAGWSPWACA